ncbi:hypothetical protein [Neptunitalea lumnitzerae]|uniref:DUF1311 domain-containing protein n=1 Tax=Neptunitalea lumnitzerae TaxID=2965509 RepID=A0ABQ5MLK9_9FLAO|nr:hypothetical protein [Neptunitalea sp. Y10]GLB50253.1 hypothetical protein Y10_26210 [Neptunitalea sp. Y10]
MTKYLGSLDFEKQRAKLISEQLRKFTDSYAYMVAGQFANIDFWINEAITSLKALDEHNIRFEKMYNAQKNWIEEKKVKVPDYCYICNGICELSHDGYITPDLPKQKIDKTEIRKKLINSVYYFLIRCYKVGLLDQEEMKSFCNQIGTDIDPYDLKK